MTEAPTTPAIERPPLDDGRPDIHLNEDWAATIVGLALVVLVLAGVVTHGMLFGLVP